MAGLVVGLRVLAMGVVLGLTVVINAVLRAFVGVVLGLVVGIAVVLRALVASVVFALVVSIVAVLWVVVVIVLGDVAVTAFFVPAVVETSDENQNIPVQAKRATHTLWSDHVIEHRKVTPTSVRAGSHMLATPFRYSRGGRPLRIAHTCELFVADDALGSICVGNRFCASPTSFG